MRRVRGIWAKTGSGGTWLPLEAHLDDCATVMRQLWQSALTPRQRRWLAREWGLDEGETETFAVAMAGIHDLGKASEPFQLLQPELAARLRGDESKGAGHHKRVRHDAITGEALRRWLTANGVGTEVAAAVVATVAGHHGAIRGTRDLRDASDVLLGSRWRATQSEILDERVEGQLVEQITSTPGTAAVLALAGWISVADWLASDVEQFPISRGATFDRDRASEVAVGRRNWRMDPPAPTTFEQVFADQRGRPRAPRPSQRAMIELLAKDGWQPSLILLEDRTGSGKTEAALWAAKRALETGAAGVYIGMPTRATATQLHSRAKLFAERLWPDANPIVRLMHAAANLNLGVSASEDDSDPAEAASWFDGKRRGLLAPFGVGTIDQALLGALRSKHFFVRLAGLQGKVVIVDETHAYDAYTGGILGRLLTWLAALDCTVVLLSATLSASQRDALCAAYEDGLSVPAAGSPTSRLPPRPRQRAGAEASRGAGVLAYPRITTTGGMGSRRTLPIVDDRPGRAVSIEQAGLSAESEAELVDVVIAELEGERGGCVAVVCNTVSSAQRRWRALRASLPADTGCLLLHARQRPVERRPIEAEILEMLGPPDAGVQRPDRLVVVATQIIEQSLDLDFDVMLSDLAPIDLLIQRAGRIHRHGDRVRSPRHREPRLVVLDHAGTELARPYLKATDLVYDVGPLARTRLAIRSRTVLREPEDLDALIEAVYGRSTPSGLAPEEAACVAECDAVTDERRTKLRQAAKTAMVPAVTADPIWHAGMDARGDADELLPAGNFLAETRFSELPSINAVVLAPDELLDARITPRNSAEARDLLDRAVSISSSRVVAPLLKATKANPSARYQPLAWTGNSLLRHYHLVEIEADGTATMHDPRAGLPLQVPVALDPAEGVRIA
jgi:CRISPR-associated endonuclease/helicase Cas3